MAFVQLIHKAGLLKGAQTSLHRDPKELQNRTHLIASQRHYRSHVELQPARAPQAFETVKQDIFLLSFLNTLKRFAYAVLQDRL